MTYTTIVTVLTNRITYFLLMALGGACGAYFVYLDREDDTIHTTFKQVPCTITAAEVTVDEEIHHARSRHYVTQTYYPEFVYTYTVDGKKLEGYDYRAFEHGMTEAAATAVVDRYEEGKTATCYYNPADPEQAVLTLDSGRSGMNTAGAWGLVLLFGGLVGWVVIDFVLPRVDHSATAAAKTPDDFKLEIPAWSSLPRT